MISACIVSELFSQILTHTINWLYLLSFAFALQRAAVTQWARTQPDWAAASADPLGLQRLLLRESEIARPREVDALPRHDSFFGPSFWRDHSFTTLPYTNRIGGDHLQACPVC
jgi:hypothetical protein